MAATRAWVSIVKEEGRIVTVTSRSGKLAQWPTSLSQRWKSLMTTEEVDILVEEYLKTVEAGSSAEAGFTPSAYNVSKTALNAATFLMAAEPEVRDKEILLNACCPGYTKVSNYHPLGHSELM